MTTTHRHRAGQPIPDDGSCWRHLAERQQAECTRATFTASQSLDHTGSAHLIGESSDPKPGEWVRIPPRDTPSWPLFFVGVVMGAVACYAVLVIAP